MQQDSLPLLRERTYTLHARASIYAREKPSKPKKTYPRNMHARTMRESMLKPASRMSFEEPSSLW